VFNGSQAGQKQQAPDAQDERVSPVQVPDSGDQSKELDELREQGILTEEEFAAEKEKRLRL
jgi:hypothetical protein